MFRLQKYGGDLAIGAMTILTSVAQMIQLPLTGLAQGAQPILSYNFGAHRPDRMKQVVRYNILIAVLFAVSIWGVVQLAPHAVVHLFTSDEQLTEITVWALRIYMALGFTNAFQTGLSAVLRGARRGENLAVSGAGTQDFPADTAHFHSAALFRGQAVRRVSGGTGRRRSGCRNHHGSVSYPLPENHKRNVKTRNICFFPSSNLVNNIHRDAYRKRRNQHETITRRNAWRRSGLLSLTGCGQQQEECAAKPVIYLYPEQQTEVAVCARL